MVSIIIITIHQPLEPKAYSWTPVTWRIKRSLFFTSSSVFLLRLGSWDMDFILFYFILFYFIFIFYQGWAHRAPSGHHWLSGYPSKDPQEEVCLLFALQSSLPWSRSCSRITMSSGHTLPECLALWRAGPPVLWMTTFHSTRPSPAAGHRPWAQVSTSDRGIWKDTDFCSAYQASPCPHPFPPLSQPYQSKRARAPGISPRWCK